MHAFFALVEAGRGVVSAADLEARLAPNELLALRSAGIVRPLMASSAVLGAGAVEEISIADLVHALRALYRVDARGLPAPSILGTTPVTLGWGAGSNEREVVLVGRSQVALAGALGRGRRTLVLLLTGQELTNAQRTKHGAGAQVVVEVLAETLVALGGRLVRAPSPSMAAIPIATPDAPEPARRRRPRARSRSRQ